MLPSIQIQEQLQQYLAGVINLDELEDWLVSSSWNMHKDADVSAQELVGAIELRLAEHSQGHLDEGDLKHELRMILVYGYKPRAARMPVLLTTSDSERVTVNSSSFQEPPPINTIVIAGNYLTSSETWPETRSAAGRTFIEREALERSS